MVTIDTAARAIDMVTIDTDESGSENRATFVSSSHKYIEDILYVVLWITIRERNEEGRLLDPPRGNMEVRRSRAYLISSLDRDSRFGPIYFLHPLDADMYRIKCMMNSNL